MAARESVMASRSDPRAICRREIPNVKFRACVCVSACVCATCELFAVIKLNVSEVLFKVEDVCSDLYNLISKSFCFASRVASASAFLCLIIIFGWISSKSRLFQLYVSKWKIMIIWAYLYGVFLLFFSCVVCLFFLFSKMRFGFVVFFYAMYFYSRIYKWIIWGIFNRIITI